MESVHNFLHRKTFYQGWSGNVWRLIRCLFWRTKDLSAPEEAGKAFARSCILDSGRRKLIGLAWHQKNKGMWENRWKIESTRFSKVRRIDYLMILLDWGKILSLFAWPCKNLKWCLCSSIFFVRGLVYLSIFNPCGSTHFSISTFLSILGFFRKNWVRNDNWFTLSQLCVQL